MYQVIVLTGYVEEPPVSYTRPNKPLLVNFIVSARYTSRGTNGKQVKKAFFAVQCADKEAEMVINNVKAGQIVSIDGRLKFQSDGRMALAVHPRKPNLTIPQIMARQVIIVHNSRTNHRSSNQSPFPQREPQMNEQDDEVLMEN